MRRLLSRDFMLLIEVGLNISCRTLMWTHRYQRHKTPNP
jgi:hypothetical protein